MTDDRTAEDVFESLHAEIGDDWPNTDLGNAERFVAQHGSDVRHNRALGWIVWDGIRWRTDAESEVWRRAAETVRAVKDEKWAARSEAWNRQRAMLELAQHQPGVPVAVDELDARPWLFNVANGTLNLKSGKLQGHDRADMLTKLAPVTYDQKASAPRWEKFLERVLPLRDVREFMQRAIGYSITGLASEQVLFLLHGDGANGKTTFLETVRAIAGDYGQQTPASTLLARRGDGVPNDIARLRGARFVSAVETEANRSLAEALVKRLTGNDKIAARFLFKEFFEFDTEFSLWLATNHRPRVRGTDLGIWRRILLVPFTVVIPEPEQDKNIGRALAEELPGVLRWAVKGCDQWRAHGLGAPDEVLAATDAYRAEQDILADFLADRCELGDRLNDSAKNLYDAYRAWSDSTGEKPETKKAFGVELRRRGFEPYTTSERRWRGLRTR